MITLLDQLGNELRFKTKPIKVISLVPSMTELWVEMNGVSSLIGRTKFCVHPQPSIKEIQKIGGTKNPRLDQIIEMKPDLILANKEENLKEHIHILREHFPVYVSDVKTIDNNLKMVSDFERINTSPENTKQTILDAYNQVRPLDKRVSALYLIWKDPYMASGGDTFINSMLEKLGLDNILKDKNRYPEISLTDIQILNPEYILLSSEPYPFKSADIENLKQSGITSNVILVDGEAFSWYGSRILHIRDYLNHFTNSIESSKY